MKPNNVTLNQNKDPLPQSEVQAKFLAMPSLNDRVRERIRIEKDRLKLSERDIADMLDWGQSKVSQKLNGRTDITLNELESLCFAVSIAPTEAVRDPGLEFVADMTPTELRLFERIRKLSAEQRAAILMVLHIPEAPPRRATPPPKRTGPQPRPR